MELIITVGLVLTFPADLDDIILCGFECASRQLKEVTLAHAMTSVPLPRGLHHSCPLIFFEMLTLKRAVCFDLPELIAIYLPIRL